jgi:uncharacterized membrane protein YeiB
MVSTAGDRVFDVDVASQGPLAPSQRIEAIDVLRGLALLGVIAIHVVFEFRVDIFEQFRPATGEASFIDRALKGVRAFFFPVRRRVSHSVRQAGQ